jgi:RNA 2',3'-cyclic 3'-phosphodiesterase
LRLFIGVELDEPLRAACAAAARGLQERLRRARVTLAVRWTAEENLHITVWFLGHVPEEQTAIIVDRLQPVWAAPAFPVTVSGAGAFPPSGPPRTLWLGITQGADCMADLYRELAPRLAPLGFEPERRDYHPHITIGRVTGARGGPSRQARAIIETAGGPVGSCPVRSLTLFRSHLSPSGARYEPLLRVPLKEC